MAIEVQGLMQLVEAGQTRGAQSTEIFLVEQSGMEVKLTRGRPQREVSSSTTLRVRLFLEGGRMGEAAGTPKQAESLLAKALAKARKASEDPFGGPVGRLPMLTRGLGIEDQRFAGLDEADRVDVVAAAERGARSVDRRVVTSDFWYSDRQFRRVFCNSTDVVAEERSTDYHAGGTVTVGDVSVSEEIGSRSFASISSLPFGTVLAKRAIELQMDTVPLFGVHRVMMPPRVIGPLFARLATAMTVDALESGKSLFAAAHAEGVRALDHRVHLIDDGNTPGGTFTYTFDEQGAPPVALALLREGIPEGRYVDVRTARRLDELPSGHWWNGHLRPSNLMLRSGTRSMSALLSEHDTVPTLMLDHVRGWDGLDLITGDFEVVGSGFLRLGNDRTDGSVRNIRLSGNVLEVFNQLVDIASDTDRVVSVDAPGMLLDGVTVG